jgi:hypothetical protein
MRDRYWFLRVIRVILIHPQCPIFDRALDDRLSTCMFSIEVDTEIRVFD